MVGLNFSSIKTIFLELKNFHSKTFTYSLKAKLRDTLLAVGQPYGCDSGEYSHTVP